MARQRHAPARFPAPQVTLLVLGALFLVWGIVGFFFLGDPATDLAGRDTNHKPRAPRTRRAIIEVSRGA